jgi:lysozyme
MDFQFLRSVKVNAAKPAGGLALVVLAAGALMVPHIKYDEGRSNKAYWDPHGKVWTICDGETLGVKQGDYKTNSECDALTERRTRDFANQAYIRMSPLAQTRITAQTLEAHGNFAYNIGIGGYSSSMALRKTNAGDFAGGCEAMLNWYSSGGRDCRLDKGNPKGCYGLWVRRLSARDRCLKGIQ